MNVVTREKIMAKKRGKSCFEVHEIDSREEIVKLKPGSGCSKQGQECWFEFCNTLVIFCLCCLSICVEFE